MRKTIFTIATLLVANLSIAQWTNKSVDNGLDEPYRICYTRKDNGAMLKLENTSDGIMFYLQGTYFCTDLPFVELSFLVNNKWVKYSLTGMKSSQSDAIFLVDSIADSEFFISFLNSTSVKIRVNEDFCLTEIYEFNMSGSTSAFNFVK